MAKFISCVEMYEIMRRVHNYLSNNNAPHVAKEAGHVFYNSIHKTYILASDNDSNIFVVSLNKYTGKTNIVNMSEMIMESLDTDTGIQIFQRWTKELIKIYLDNKLM